MSPEPRSFITGAPFTAYGQIMHLFALTGNSLPCCRSTCTTGLWRRSSGRTILMVNWGVAPKQRQQWVRHASFEMTLDFYAKRLREVSKGFHQIDSFIASQFTKHTRW
jgi:hypothetical protein